MSESEINGRINSNSIFIVSSINLKSDCGVNRELINFKNKKQK